MRRGPSGRCGDTVVAAATHRQARILEEIVDLVGVAELKIRERIRTLVAYRLEAVEHIDEAVRRPLCPPLACLATVRLARLA